jgi:hypothetical protein
MPPAAFPLQAKQLEPRPLEVKPLDARPIVVNAGGSAVGIDLTKVVPASFPMMITNPHLPATTVSNPLRIELGGNQANPTQP